MNKKFVHWLLFAFPVFLYSCEYELEVPNDTNEDQTGFLGTIFYQNEYGFPEERSLYLNILNGYLVFEDYYLRSYDIDLISLNCSITAPSKWEVHPI
jgi:hypothetical protein